MDLLFICALAGIIIVVLSYYLRFVTQTREVAMKAELRSIRTAVNAYRAEHGNQSPENLRVLSAEKYIIQQDENTPQAGPAGRNYLTVSALDEEGYPVDPFGNRYRYDPKTGDVASETEGYGSW